MPGTVTVGCKLPHGLQLQLEREIRDGEKLTGYEPVGQVVTLKGYALPYGVFMPHVVDGVGLTHGVDADFFETWLKQKADYGPVKQGLIFAHKDAGGAARIAREREGLRNGLEPIDPDNPAPGVKKDDGRTE